MDEARAWEQAVLDGLRGEHSDPVVLHVRPHVDVDGFARAAASVAALREHLAAGVVYVPRQGYAEWVPRRDWLAENPAAAAAFAEGMRQMAQATAGAADQMRGLGNASLAWVDESPLWRYGILDRRVEHPHRTAMHTAYHRKTRHRSRRR